MRAASTSASRRAAPTTPTWAGACRAACRPTREPSRRRGSSSRRAELAANRAGGARVAELVERHGLELVSEAMRETLDYAERRTRAAIEAMDDGEREAA